MFYWWIDIWVSFFNADRNEWKKKGLLMGFWKKKKKKFSGEIADSHNSGSALRILLKFYIMKGSKKYMKNVLMGFSQKSLVRGKIKYAILGTKNECS